MFIQGIKIKDNYNQKFITEDYVEIRSVFKRSIYIHILKNGSKFRSILMLTLVCLYL